MFLSLVIIWDNTDYRNDRNIQCSMWCNPDDIVQLLRHQDLPNAYDKLTSVLLNQFDIPYADIVDNEIKGEGLKYRL